MTADAAPGLRFPWEEPPGPTDVIEVADGIFWIRSPLPMRLDHVNCYAIDEGDSWTIVDTGMNTTASREAWETILTGPLGAKPVGRVVITHHHPDHIGLAGWFVERGAALWATRLGYALGRMMWLDRNDVWPAETVLFRRRAGMPEADIAEMIAGKPWSFSKAVAPIPLGFHVIDDGAEIEMGGRHWRIHFGNGHAAHHATFWSDDVILAGDQIIPGISSNIGVWALEPDADPLGGWLESCRRLRAVAGDTRALVLPGHKMPFHGAAFRLTGLLENHEHALDRIMEALVAGPLTAHEVFIPVFGREITGTQYGLALSEAVAHMNHLMHEGRVRRSLDGEVWRFEAV